MALSHERIPFAEAISEPLLLKKRFDSLSLPQQVALKAFYGVPLKGAELDIWATFQENVVYDHLGYPIQINPTPYIPKEYSQAWLNVGRRGSKTDAFTATAFAYEATLGGHMQYVRPRQDVRMLMVAQKKDLAVANLNFIRTALDSSPILAKEVVESSNDVILFKSGMKITAEANNIKSQRGWAVPVVAMDEVAFWYSDSESANPDYEVERGVAWAQLQFPHYKRIGTSTPWTKEGLLYKYWEAGTEGRKLPPSIDPTQYRGILVIHASTAAMGNPHVTRDALELEHARDPEAFERESLARFVDSISGFLPAPLLRDAVEKGTLARQPYPRPNMPNDPAPYYVAAIDPGFRRDGFTMTIMHSDPLRGMVQDVIWQRKPTPGHPALNPVDVLAELAPTFQQYRIRVVYSDQYQLESLQQLALQAGFAIEGVDFTSKSKAKIMGSLQQLLLQKRLVLLDNPEMLSQLLQLERRLLPQGGVQIAAPPGKHDDLATVTALAAFKALWLLPEQPTVVVKEKTLFDYGMETIRKRRQDAFGASSDW